MLFLIGWFACGTITAILLILSANIGQRYQYIRVHWFLLITAIFCGPIGCLVALIIGLFGLSVIKIGNKGGFQEK
jgi:hypothetical protein